MSTPSALNDSAPGISVVIPCYNYARFLTQAVDSCLLQNYPNYEVILVDDGSQDNTAEVAAKYGGRIRYVYQQNAGLPSARNTGIRAARHAYVAFLDADDIFLPGCFAAVMKKFARLPADFSLVVPNHEYVLAEGQPMPVRRYDLEWDREITVRDILMRSRFQPSGVITRRSVFEDCGFFDLPLRSSEDRDMWIRITARHRAWRMGEVFVQIRKHGNNMSNNADRMRTNMRTVLIKSWRNRVVPRSDVCFWLRVASFWCYQTSLLYAGCNRPFTAYRDLIFSALLWPWFPRASRLNLPNLFRARSFVRYALDAMASGRAAESKA